MTEGGICSAKFRIHKLCLFFDDLQWLKAGYAVLVFGFPKYAMIEVWFAMRGHRKRLQCYRPLRFDSGYLIKDVGGRKGTEHTLPLGYYHSWLVVKTIPCLRVSDIPNNLMIESWIFVLENSCDCWDTRCQMVLGNVACAHCVPIPSRPSFLPSEVP